MSNLKKRILKSLNPHLRQRVARRFSVLNREFQVVIDGDEVTLHDRNYFNNLEYSLVYGEYHKNHDKSNLDPNKIELNYREGKTKEGHIVRGWIGLVENSKTLQDGGDNLNKISVIVRGKVAQEDILASFRDGGLHTKYVIGELEADFLDSTNEDDIATSSREHFIGDDKRFSAFLEFVQEELKYLKKERGRVKDKKGIEKAKEIPAIKKWYEKLRGDTKDAAEKFFGRINTIAIDDEHRKTLLKYGVLAFTHLRHKELLGKLDQLNIENLETTVELFSKLDDIEANWYHQITKGRLDVIQILSKCVSNDARERVIQEHIGEHLWLLDPSWDRATEMPILEESIIKSFNNISEKLTKGEEKARPDIRYKKVSGEHVIIELKRSSINTNHTDLMTQMNKYMKILKEQLKKNRKTTEKRKKTTETIEGIFLLGKLPDGWEDDSEFEKEAKDALKAHNMRVITYHDLIENAESSYKLYLKKDERRELQELLDGIDEFDYNAPK